VGNIVAKRGKLSLRRWRQNLGDVAAVDECEGVDVAPQTAWQMAHAPDPVVLQRVVLGLDEDMETQDGLKERRVGKGQALDGVSREMEADHD
jgi:hypothetical protein